MLDVPERHKAYFDEVRQFAEKIGKWDVAGDNHCLKKWFDWLDNYAGKENTKCELYPDRPYGFGFVMYKKNGEQWNRWFNGGLLYHGSHDGFGSGAGPTFAVTLNPTDGWSVHT